MKDPCFQHARYDWKLPGVWPGGGLSRSTHAIAVGVSWLFVRFDICFLVGGVWKLMRLF